MVKAVLQAFRIGGKVVFGRADVAMPGHVLRLAQAVGFDPMYNAGATQVRKIYKGRKHLFKISRKSFKVVETEIGRAHV